MADAFALAAVPPAGGGTYVVTLSFTRADRVQDSAGGITLSYVAVTPVDEFTGELYPQRGRYVRTPHGTLEQVYYKLYLVCNADLRAGDRTSGISNFNVEVVNVRHYGQELTHIDLSYVR